MPQIQVYLSQQDPAADEPAHRCSKTFADRLAALLPHLVSYNSALLRLQLKTPVAWNVLKDRLRKVGKPVRVQDSGMGLMLSYPPIGQETDAASRQRKLWTNAVRF